MVEHHGVDLVVGRGRLHIVSIARLDDIRLGDFKTGDVRLVVLAPPAELLGDPLASWCFEHALARRGLLKSVRADLPALVLDLASAADEVAQWLAQQLDVTVAVLGAPIALVAAMMLVAADRSPAEAIAMVEQRLPGPFGIGEQIAVSVGLCHVDAYRELQRRRAEAVQRGSSPWDVQ